MSSLQLCSKPRNKSRVSSLRNMGATSEKNFQCFLCSEKFSLATDLADHIESHNIQKAFQCGFCNESFHENSDILSHISSMHGGLPVLYNCSICKVAFQALLSLEEHVAGCQGNVTNCLNSGSLGGKAQFRNENIDLEAKDKTIKYLLNRKADHASERVLFHKICDEIFQTDAGSENVPKSEISDGLDDFGNGYTSSDFLRLNEESNQDSKISKTAKLLGNTERSLKSVQAYHLPNAHKLNNDNMRDGTDIALSESLDTSINHVEKSGVKKLHDDKRISRTSLISNHTRVKVSTCISSKTQKARSHKQKNNTHEKNHISNKTSSFNLSSKQLSAGNDGKEFLCKICMQACTSQENLEEHMGSHALEECYIIRCIKCNVCFDDAELLEKHLEQTNCSGFKCLECSQSFGLEALLLKHTILAHKQGFEIKCSECGKICSSQYAWARHEATHAKSQPYMCKICGKHLSSLEHVLRYHLPTAHKLGKKARDRKTSMLRVSKASSFEKDKNCDVRDENNKQSFLKKRRVSSKPITSRIPKKSKVKVLSAPLPNEQNKEKTDPKRWVCLDCDICGGKVSDHHALSIHRSYHFMEDKSIIHCSGCPEKFSQLADLSSHVQQKQCSKFRCDNCEQIFPTELSFVLHKSESHILPQESGFYSCLECQQNFESHAAYVDHSAEHASSQPFECKICSATFTSEILLEAHFEEAHTLIKNNQENNAFKCAQCLETFRTKMAITVHRRFHMQREVLSENKDDCHKPESSFASYMTPFFCEICSVGFSGAVQLERHEQLHGAVADKPKCHICGQIFQRNCYLKVHLGHHNRPFLCTACGKTFASSQTLKHHSLAYHSAVNPYQCQQCHKFYSSKGALRHHMKGHLGEKRFECKICGKKFSDSTCLESHILNHSAEKRFKCKVCNYECRHRSVLSRHMDMHSGVKRYKCPHCGKRFRQQSGWKAHLTVHTGEKNYECEYCGKRFARKDYLNVHILTHTKEKPMTCPICGDRFAVTSNLNVHVRKVHGEKDFKWFQEQKAKNKGLNGASVKHNTLPVQETDAVTTTQVPATATPLQNPIAPPGSEPDNSMMCGPSLYPPPIYEPDNSSEHSVYHQTQQMFYW